MGVLLPVFLSHGTSGSCVRSGTLKGHRFFFRRSGTIVRQQLESSHQLLGLQGMKSQGHAWERQRHDQPALSPAPSSLLLEAKAVGWGVEAGGESRVKCVEKPPDWVPSSPLQRRRPGFREGAMQPEQDGGGRWGHPGREARGLLCSWG